MDEKRTYPRIALHEVIKYANGIKGRAKDVSLSGIRFIAGEKLKEGTPLNLYFNLQTNTNLIKTTGQIIWTRNYKPQTHEIGFNFVSINNEGRIALSQYINQYLQQKNQQTIRQKFLIEVMVNYCIHAKAKPLNITAAGMSLFTDTPLAEKKILLLSIPLPAGDNISMHGKTIWNKQLQQNLFENGIEFWNIDNIEKEKLFNFVKAV